MLSVILFTNNHIIKHHIDSGNVAKQLIIAFLKDLEDQANTKGAP